MKPKALARQGLKPPPSGGGAVTRAWLGSIAAWIVLALVILALAIGGVAERMCRPKKAR